MSFLHRFKHKSSAFFALLLILSMGQVGVAVIGFCEVAAVNSSASISGVEFEGNQRIDTEALRLQLAKQSGDFSAAEVSEAVKSVYRTGFFDDVSASVSVRGGKRILIFKLVERPTVRKIYIQGNEKLSDSELSKVLTFDARRFFDRSKVQGLLRAAKNLYEGRGYFDAELEYRITPAANNQVDITFEVKEGLRYKITEVIFNGLDKIDSSELQEVMNTSRYKWWSSWLLGSGRLNREALEGDKQNIRQFFVDHGFLDGTVSDPSVDKLELGQLRISFDLSEGAQYKIAKIASKGDLLSTGEDSTLEDLKSKVGSTFSAAKVRADSFTISERFGDEGYAFTNVVPGTEMHRDSATVDLTFEIQKGNKATINRINIHGNTKTYDRVVRREIRVNEQEQYSGTKVKRSEALLRRSGYFEEASITTGAAADNKEKVDLDVNVKEGTTGSFSVGAGFSTSDGALFNTRLAENNLFGTGRRAELSVDVGTQRNNVIASVDDPRLGDTYVSGGVDAYYTEREFRDFDRDLSGIGTTIGYPLEEVFGEFFQDISAAIKYEYKDINIRNVDVENAAPLVIASEGHTTASGVTPRITRNTIDNPLNPTSGSKQTLSVEVTGLGAQEEYYVFEIKSGEYVPVVKWEEWGALVFSHRLFFAYGDTFNGEPLPLFRRYFPGGINSVRGYTARTLGPKDADGNEYGGAKEFTNNFELLFPLIPSAGLKLLGFYDIGQAFDDNESVDLAELRQAYGTGLRWNSPLGPIRIEFGFPLDKKEGERSMVTMFSFGAPF